MTLTGLAADEPDPVHFEVRTAGGETLIAGGLLYFDGSSFAEYGWDLPASGSYELAFEIPAGGDVVTGSFTFVLAQPQDGSDPGGDAPAQDDTDPQGTAGGDDGGASDADATGDTPAGGTDPAGASGTPIG